MKLSAIIVAIVITAIVLPSVSAQETGRRVRIRNWEFEWKVVESGNATFKIIKTDDILYTSLTAGMMGMSRVRLTPQQAERVASLLWDTDKQLRVLKGVAEQKNEKVRKKVNADGDIQVVYAYDPKLGGRVYVAEEQSFMLDVGFSVSEAEALAGKMENAVALCITVDTKIKPND